MTKDLHEENDGLWTFDYVKPEDDLSLSNPPQKSLSVKTAGEGKDLCILTYGNGNYLSRQAQKLLEAKGINASVVDLRYLAPLDEAGILAQVQSAKCTLIVDECRETGSISEALFTLIAESGVEMNQVARICAQDSFIPLGSAAYHVLPSKEDIVEQAIALIERVS